MGSMDLPPLSKGRCKEEKKNVPPETTCALLLKPRGNLNFPLRWFLPYGHCQCTYKESMHKHANRHTHTHGSALLTGKPQMHTPIHRGSHAELQMHAPTHTNYVIAQNVSQSSHKNFLHISASCLNPCKSQQLLCLINPPRDHTTC